MRRGPLTARGRSSAPSPPSWNVMPRVSASATSATVKTRLRSFGSTWQGRWSRPVAVARARSRRYSTWMASSSCRAARTGAAGVPRWTRIQAGWPPPWSTTTISSRCSAPARCRSELRPTDEVRGVTGSFRNPSDVSWARCVGLPGRGGLVRLQERPDMLDDLPDGVLGLLPRVDRRLRVGGEAHDLHRDCERMRWDVVRQDQHRGPAGSHEVARGCEDEVGRRAVEVVQIALDHLHRDVGPPRAEGRSPVRDVVVPEDVRALGPVSAGLAQDGGHHALRRSLEQLEYERAADAVAQHEELVRAQVVHQTELVVRVGVPGLLDLQGPR